MVLPFKLIGYCGGRTPEGIQVSNIKGQGTGDAKNVEQVQTPSKISYNLNFGRICS